MRIATKMVLAFGGFTLACVGLSGALLILETQDALEEALVERQQLLTANRALALAENLAIAAGELGRLSRMAEIDMDDGDLRPEQRVLAQAYGQSSSFNDALELYGPRGHCRWAEPAGSACAGHDARETDWFRDVMAGRSRRLYVTEPDGNGLLDLVEPVTRNGATVGVLRGVVDLSRDQMIAHVLQSELPPSTSAALLTPDGRVVLHRGARRLDDVRFAQAHAALRAGRAGNQLIDVDGETILLAWNPIGRFDLGLVFAWPLDALDDRAERQLRSLWGMMAVVGLLASAIGLVLAGLITRPLRRLALVIERVKARRLDVLPSTARADEVGDLQRAFRSLLSTLADHENELRADRDRIAELADHLEARVDARTRELRDTQGALVRAERLAAVGRAGAVLSHELRNALNAVSIAMDTLEADDSEVVRRQARRLVRVEVARLRTLSDDLLTFAREPTLRTRAVPLSELLENASLLVDDHAATHGVTLEVSPVGDDRAIVVDPDRSHTVLINILRNAVDAAAESEKRLVRVTSAWVGDELELRVEDSGTGVPETVAGRLFQPFVTGRVQGIGLGLAIAERFTRAHGGRIELTKGTLSGACFVVRLPRAGPARGEETA